MYEAITEQFQNSLAPINEMFANNAKVLMQLTEQQTKLFTEIMNESVEHTKKLSKVKDWPGAIEAQTAFVGRVQSKLVSAGENTSKLFSESQKNSTKLFSEAQEQISKLATEAQKETERTLKEASGSGTKAAK